MYSVQATSSAQEIKTMETKEEKRERELKTIRSLGMGWLETVRMNRAIDVEFGIKRQLRKKKLKKEGIK